MIWLYVTLGIFAAALVAGRLCGMASEPDLVKCPKCGAEVEFAANQSFRVCECGQKIRLLVRSK